MCGIAGWVSFDTDLARDQRARAVLDAMTQTMACRGPDASGIELSGPVALGHRRLAIIDLDGGAQPMSVNGPDGRALVSLTYSGEVYNHVDLRGELTSLGHRFTTRSDTEVVLRAYLQWGDNFVDRFDGMFAFALWDSRTEHLLLVRDRLGIKPLFFRTTPDGVLFGSEQKAIFAHPEARPAVDAEGLAELLTIAKTPGHAIYRGVHEVLPGAVVRVGRGGTTHRRYWTLQSHEHLDDLPTTIARVRELLDSVIADQLVADVPVCTLLSGGLDSSALTALAAQQLRHSSGSPVRSFAVDFSAIAEEFRADDLRGTPDAPFARALAAHVGADHAEIVLDARELVDETHRASVLTARDVPLGVGEIDTSLYLLFRAIRAQSTVALSGEGADELFGGYRWFHDGSAAAADTFPWATIFSARGFSGRNERGTRTSLLDAGLLAKLDPGNYLRDRYAEAIREVPALPGEDPVERRMREICFLHLTRHLQFFLDRKDRMSMATGLEVRVPFCDHRLVEYVFNTPWSMKAFDGREKSLLRAAVADVLPRSVAERVKSPYPSSQDTRYAEALRARLRAVLADRDAPVHALLDPQAAAAAAAASADHFLSGVEVVLALDGWFRQFAPSLDL